MKNDTSILDLFSQINFPLNSSCEFSLDLTYGNKNVVHFIPGYGKPVKKEVRSNFIRVPTFVVEGGSKEDVLLKVCGEATRLLLETAISHEGLIGNYCEIDVEVIKELKTKLEKQGYGLDTLVCSGDELFDIPTTNYLVEHRINIWPIDNQLMILGLDRDKCRQEFVIPIKSKLQQDEDSIWTVELGLVTLTNKCIVAI